MVRQQCNAAVAAACTSVQYSVIMASTLRRCFLTVASMLQAGPSLGYKMGCDGNSWPRSVKERLPSILWRSARDCRVQVHILTCLLVMRDSWPAARALPRGSRRPMLQVGAQPQFKLSNHSECTQAELFIWFMPSSRSGQVTLVLVARFQIGPKCFCHPASKKRTRQWWRGICAPCWWRVQQPSRLCCFRRKRTKRGRGGRWKAQDRL